MSDLRGLRGAFVAGAIWWSEYKHRNRDAVINDETMSFVENRAVAQYPDMEVVEVGIESIGQWQPVSTMPRDGEVILVLTQSEQMYIAYYSHIGARMKNMASGIPIREDCILYWLPIPAISKLEFTGKGD